MSKCDSVAEQVAQIIVDVPSRNTNQIFDYVIPAELSDRVRLGSRVMVPFGSRKTQGYVVRFKHREEVGYQLKEIERVLDEIPPLTEELIKLGEWMSKEYICLQSTALQAMLPTVLKAKAEKRILQTADGEEKVEYMFFDRVTKRFVSFVKPSKSRGELEKAMLHLRPNAKKQKQIIQFFIANPKPIELTKLLQSCQVTRATVLALQEKGLVSLYKEEQRRDPYQNRHFKPSSPLPLTKEQASAFREIKTSIDQGKHNVFLLHGVTGSGKTEVYLHAIARTLEKGREAIVLVPEISLTPQMVERFKGRFGSQVAVIHSGLAAGERYDEWRKIQEKKVKIAIGARSALFAPFTNIGLIIIDEEHENSYKQEENPRYHARDIAIFRGKYHDAPVILGSATPSLESYARAKKGVFHLLTLQERVENRPLPPVTVVDMRAELHKGNRTMFSSQLYKKIQHCLDKEEQMVLFLNRRGFSTFVMCRDCGYVVGCPHCDISLTYHKVNHLHLCHYCGYSEPSVVQCPMCQSQHIRFFGTGTQRVEEELYKFFPGIKVIRMDVDTTRRKGAHEKLINAFKNGEADCLLGTQMIAKGLDFEKVTLVGVIAADSLLYLPDFRAAEKTFQLITQVSGRAGRHHLPGEVIVQTYSPEHYSIQCAARHDYQGFYEQEMRLRFERGYLPYYYLAMLTFAHEDLPYLVKIAHESVAGLKEKLSSKSVILGPVPATVPKVKDRYRYQCMIKYRDEPGLSDALTQMLEELNQPIMKDKLYVHIDVRP